MPQLDWIARLVVRLLRRRLPATLADDIVGDLIEHYGRRTSHRQIWLVSEAIKLGWRLRRAPVLILAPKALIIEPWIRDTRYACRSLLRSRGFAMVALMSLALGLGLSTAVFSVIDGVLLRPLPYPDADRIVRIRQIDPGRPPAIDEVERSLLRAWTLTTRTLSAIGLYGRADARIAVDAAPHVGVKVEVGSEFFDVLGAVPQQGRLLGVADGVIGSPMTAVLSHAFWKGAFGGAPRVVGRRIVIDDRPVEVVGVLPEWFEFPSPDVAVYLPGRWILPDVPVGMGRAVLALPLEVIGRVAPGATPTDVEREGTQVASARMASGATQPPRLEVMRLQDDLTKDVRPALVMVVAAVACVLAIICVNFTNLLLARGTVRQREMAVRAALGATRWGMTRPLVLEGLLLTLAGGAAGLVIAGGLVASIPLTASIDPMLASQIAISGRVLCFTAALCVAIGVVVGGLPAWQTPASSAKAVVSASHVSVLPGVAVRAERVRGALVVVQVALAMILATGATVLARSLVTLLTVDLGFTPEQTLSFQVRLPPKGAAYDWRARFYEQLVSQIGAHPGVIAAGFTSSLPMQETFSQTLVRIDGVAPAAVNALPRAHRESVTPGYFEALGLRVTSGRPLQPADTATSERVLVVNDAFVATLLPGRDPIGYRVLVFGDWFRIVGVVKSKRHTGLRGQPRPEMFTALAQSPPDVATQSGAGIAVRVNGSPMDVLPMVRLRLQELQPQAAIENQAALADRVWSSTAQPRFYASVMAVFAVLAMVTALVGLFGVLSYVVERRRVEIGVRRALGATGGDITRLVLGKGMRLVAIAMPIGLIGTIAGAGLLRNLLFGIEPVDPITIAIVAVVVPIVALTACVWPARRANAIAPLDALRDE